MDFQAIPPPQGYTSLAQVMTSPVETDVNVIGVVVDHMAPTSTRGSDWTCNMFLQDSSLLGSTHNQTGVQVRIFRLPSQMPQNVQLGDIVLIRGTRWRDVHGNQFLIDTRKTGEYLFFSGSAIPDDAFKAPHVVDETRIITHSTLPGQRVAPPTAAEQDYIIKLKEWTKKHNGWLPQPGEQGAHPAPPRAAADTTIVRQQLPPKPSFAGTPAVRPPGPRSYESYKFANLKDIREATFHDLAGEVIKIWDSGHCVDLYISDYTFNPQLYDYNENDDKPDGRDGDEYGYTTSVASKRQWNGPLGRHTIQVAVWPPHSSYVQRELREGEFVKLRNVRCHVKNGYMQASLHEDRKHPDRVDVTKLPYTHDLYKMVNELKEQYWEARSEKPKNMSRQQKKKRKKEEKKAQLNARKRLASEEAVLHAQQDQDDAECDGLFVEQAKDKVNPRVIAAYPDRPTLPLIKILETPFRTYRSRQGEEITLSFINQKCRTKVRVVDYYPDKLEDFASDLDDPNYNDLMSSHDESRVSLEGDSSPPSRWEWCFKLLVEDARTIPGQEPVRIVVLVHGTDAVHLLGMEATDLKQNLQVKHQLETKLWTVWGNLQELKEQETWTGAVRPSNHPFECCLDEYGIWNGTLNLDGEPEHGEYERVYRLKQTLIRDH